MTLPSSPDSISFSQIEYEFGENPKRSLGEYRIKQTIGDMSNLPLDKDIPLRSTETGPGITSTPDNNTTIKFSDFYGKRLNIILDYFKSQHIEEPSAREGYNRGSGTFREITVVGGFKNKPNKPDGKKIYIHVSAIIGGKRGNRHYCALRTGTWPTSIRLYINIGSGGGLIGAGGEGGQGGGKGSDGENGENGSSALGIQHKVQELVVQEGGFIREGGGGGGGGGGAKSNTNGDVGGDGGDGAGSPGNTPLDTETGQITGDSGGDGTTGNSTGDAGGGGGGGGGCYPGGSVGEFGEGANPSGGSAEDGQDGSTSKGGDGGNGSAGGDPQKEGSGGTGGNNGYAIIRENASFLDENNDISGTISGTIHNENVPDPRT